MELRDREVPMRGMDRAKSAQELIDAARIHYDFAATKRRRSDTRRSGGH
jgi:hypothetical protein